MLAIVHRAYVYSAVPARPNEGAELCLEACDCRRVVEVGTIVVVERGEALELLDKPFIVYNHIELRRGDLLSTEDGRVFVCACVHGVIVGAVVSLLHYY